MHTDDIGGLADLLSDSRARGVVGELWVAVLFMQNPPVNEKCPVTVHHRAVSV